MKNYNDEIEFYTVDQRIKIEKREKRRFEEMIDFRIRLVREYDNYYVEQLVSMTYDQVIKVV